MARDRVIRDYAIAIGSAVTVALTIRIFFLEAYRIPTPAMRPTLEAGDTIFVWKLPFGIRWPGSARPWTTGRMPHYGEVVIFSPPSDPGRDYIKRVVACPGDTVALAKGKLSLNGKAVSVGQPDATCGSENLPQASYPVCWEPPLPDDFGPERVPEGHVFVLGDLRTASPDSQNGRNWGMMPLQAIEGKAAWIWLSVQPSGFGESGGWFSRIRFERMFRSIR